MSQLKEGLLPRNAEKEVRFIDRSGNDERSYGKNCVYGIEEKDGTIFEESERMECFFSLRTGSIRLPHYRRVPSLSRF